MMSLQKRGQSVMFFFKFGGTTHTRPCTGIEASSYAPHVYADVSLHKYIKDEVEICELFVGQWKQAVHFWIVDSRPYTL